MIAVLNLLNHISCQSKLLKKMVILFSSTASNLAAKLEIFFADPQYWRIQAARVFFSFSYSFRKKIWPNNRLAKLQCSLNLYAKLMMMVVML